MLGMLVMIWDTMVTALAVRQLPVKNVIVHVVNDIESVIHHGKRDDID